MKTGRREIVVSDDDQTLARAVAEHVVRTGSEAIERRGHFNLALAGGSTPKAAYHALHESDLRNSLDWSLVRFFFGDERCVPPGDDRSNYKMAKAALLDPLQIRPHAVYRMPGESEPAAAACAYAETLRHELGTEPVFDLVMLGMGDDGHTASLFPGEDPATDDAALVRAPWVEKLSAYRLTITAHVINSAREVAIGVQGAGKAGVLAEVLEGPVRPSEYPIQIVAPRSERLTWYIDRAAASALTP